MLNLESAEAPTGSPVAAPAAEAPRVVPITVTEDPLAKMGYTASEDPLKAMGYDKDLPPMPEEPTREAVMKPSELQPTVLPEEFHSVTVDTPPPVQEPAQGEATNGNERIGSLEAEVASLKARVAELTKPGVNERINKAFEGFGVKIGRALGKFQHGLEQFTDYENNSELVQLYRRIERTIGRGLEAANDAWNGKQEAVKTFMGTPTVTISGEKPPTTTTIPEKPAATVISPEAVVTQPESTAGTPEKEAAAPEMSADRLREAYDKLHASPETMEFVEKLEAFAEEYGMPKEFVQGALLTKLGEEGVEALRIIRENPEGMEFMKKLQALGVTAEEANMAIGKQFGVGTGGGLETTVQAEEQKSEAASAEAPQDDESAQKSSVVTPGQPVKAAPATATPQPAVETAPAKAPSRELSAGEMQERRRQEMRELIRNQRGYTESDLPIGEQIRQHSFEQQRLAKKAEQNPPEALEATRTDDEQTTVDGQGRTINESLTFQYEGDLENPEALKGAITDQALKIEVKRALLDSHSGENQTVADKLDLFRQQVGSLLGDSDMVELDRGDLTSFEPGQTNMTMRYEKGRVKLIFRPLSEPGQPAHPNNSLDTSFRYEKA